MFNHDIADKTGFQKCKANLSASRPLLTHITPDATSFVPTSRTAEIPSLAYEKSMASARNGCALAMHLVSMFLFVVIEQPADASMFDLPCFQKLKKLAGFYTIKVDMCMYSSEQRPEKHTLQFLTNAPWMVSLKAVCTGKHSHGLPRRGCRHTWRFCTRYMKILETVPTSLKMLHTDMPIQKQKNFVRVSSMIIDCLRPNIPLTFTCGEFDNSRRYCIPTTHADEVPIMAPARASAYIEDDPDKELSLIHI